MSLIKGEMKMIDRTKLTTPLEKESLEQTKKMNRYTESTRVEPTLKMNKPEAKKNSVFGKVS